MLQTSLAGGLLFCPHCRAAYRSDFVRCPLDGALLAGEGQDPLIGATIGEHYIIEECIAYGATSRVYRAHHARLTRRAFAIKVLLGDLIATGSTRMRFAQEAELLSRLDHPNVVSVVDFARTREGLLYLVMDLASGPSLAELIRLSGPLQWRRVVTIAQQLCLGLGHAHDQGIIHRDFKPDNVIIEYSSEVETPRIVDFGIALTMDVEASPRLTGLGLSMGTPAYAAPEQTRNHAIDHRADLFALGVTLYEMLAGVLPFNGDVAEIIHMNAFAEAPAISERNPSVVVPPELERVVRRLMMRNPEQRYHSVYEALRALDQIVGTTTQVVVRLAVTSAPVVATGQMRTVSQQRAVAPRDAALETTILPGRSQFIKVTPPRWPWVLIGASMTVVTAVVIAQLLGYPSSRSRTKPVADASRSNQTVVQVETPEPEVVSRSVTNSASAENSAPAERDAERDDDIDRAADTKERVRPSRPGKQADRKRGRKRSSNGSASKARAGSATAARRAADEEPDSEQAVETEESPRESAKLATSEPVPVQLSASPSPAIARPVPLPVAKPPVVEAPAASATTAVMRLAGQDLQVTGSLSLRTVERAFERVRSAVAGCAKLSTSDVATVRFVVDERGRATGVSVNGTGAGLSSCLRSAIGRLRTESPPDVGTVDAVLQLTFAASGSS